MLLASGQDASLGRRFGLGRLGGAPERVRRLYLLVGLGTSSDSTGGGVEERSLPAEAVTLATRAGMNG